MITAAERVEFPMEGLVSKPFCAGRLGLRLGLLDNAVERLLGFSALNTIHTQANRTSDHPVFAARCLEWMDVTWRIDGLAEAMTQTADKPVVVVANHPFGGLEGMVLDITLRTERADTKLIVSKFLAGIPEFADTTIVVDNIAGGPAVAGNASALKKALGHLRSGGCLGVFPAGEVAAYQLRTRRIEEGAWSGAIAAIAERSGAMVVPVFFEGTNRKRFHAAGVVHPRLRTALLARELAASSGREVYGVAGEPIDAAEALGDMSSDDAATMLRERCLGLDPACRTTKRLPEISPEEDPADIRRELNRLPDERVLVSLGPLDVVVFDAQEAPALMRQVGRERERTFRLVGEGTGKSADIDRFDAWYKQLIVWDRAHSRLVGGYRIGLTDEILRERGLDGLYSASLFRFRENLIHEMSPALELGRSFVVPEHQRSHAPLMLLWKGIGAFVIRQPKYRCLFGAVSISAEYSSVSRDLLVRFLKQHAYLPRMAKLLKARNPLKIRRGGRVSHVASSGDLDELNRLIREIEKDGKPMPVLLRQYLKLNAKLLAFSVDPDFGDVVDGLMLVDLAAVDRRVLEKYMGRDGAAAFLEHQSIPASV